MAKAIDKELDAIQRESGILYNTVNRIAIAIRTVYSSNIQLSFDQQLNSEGTCRRFNVLYNV